MTTTSTFIRSTRSRERGSTTRRWPADLGGRSTTTTSHSGSRSAKAASGFDKAELAALRPKSTRTIEVTDFVALGDIDPIYYERTHWLAPDGEAAIRPYQLLRAAMETSGRAAIGTVAMRNKQYLTAIRPLDGALAMSTMRFADEVVPRREIDELPSRRTKPTTKELRMAQQLIDALAAEWKPEHYHDTYVEELRARIDAKEVAKIETVDEPAPTADVLDLTEALQRSLEQGRSKPRARRRRRSA